MASAGAIGSGIESFGKSVAGIPASIKAAQADQVANSLASQLANSGNYAPRAALVNPGVDPLTQSINTVKAGVPGASTIGGAISRVGGGGSPGNPYGVDVVTQGVYPGSDVGTPPVVAKGGEAGLRLRIALENLKREAAGGTPLQQAVERARLENTQAHTDYLRTIPEENRQDRLDKQRQAQQDREDRLQMQENEKNADTIPKLTTEIEKTTGSGTTAQWTQDFITPYGHRGTFKNGTWVNDPQNGDYYALPSNETAGVAGNQIPDGTPRDQIGTVTTLDNAQRWKQRAQRIAEAGGRYVEPLKSRASTTPGGGGSIPSVTNLNDVSQLPTNVPTFRDPNGYIRQNPNYRP